MLKHLKAVTAAALLLGASGAAADAAVYNLAPSPGVMPTNTSLTRTFTTAMGGSGTLDFAIQGYMSLDGVNFYEDDVSVFLNGTQIFYGSFDLGGGGSNQLFSSNPGTTYSVSPISTGMPTFAGGLLTASVPITLASGFNRVIFTYTSLSDAGHAGFQGIADEGWGLTSGTVTSAVPEPSTWAMMFIGLLGLGFLMRRSPRTRLIA